MGKYIKPSITSKMETQGIIPLAAVASVEGIAAIAALAGAVTGLTSDDKFHPEHMRSLVKRKA